MTSPRFSRRKLGGALLLAAVASVVSMVASANLSESGAWQIEYPTHQVIAAVVASMTMWAFYPRRGLVVLWVFMPLAFLLIFTISIIVALVMLMPS